VGIRRVGVVGAGFAGLRAAHLLACAGLEVTVLEARDRVGGRVWSSFPFGPQARIERGAEFVLPGNTTVDRVAGELGLALVGMGISYGVRHYRGAAPTSSAAVRAAALTVVALLDGDPSLAGSWTAAAVLDRAAAAGADPAALAALGARVEVTNGVGLAEQPAGVLADLDEATADVESRRVAGGNQQIALAMARELDARVRLGHAVQRLEQAAGPVGRAGQVLVSGLDGGGARFELAVDACVLAVPQAHATGLLAGLTGSGGALDLLGRLGQGHAAKLHVPLLGPAAAAAVFDVPGRWWSWTARDGAGDGADDPGQGRPVAPVVHCFAGSARVLDALDVGSGPQVWAQRLAEGRPDLPLEPGRALVTDWGADPWALGAYGYPVAGAWAGGAPLEPGRRTRLVGSVVLAGEWTAGPWSGFMEGALRSGERAAADVLALPAGPAGPADS